MIVSTLLAVLVGGTGDDQVEMYGVWKTTQDLTQNGYRVIPIT